jgi:hypothetical protein
MVASVLDIIRLAGYPRRGPITGIGCGHWLGSKRRVKDEDGDGDEDEEYGSESEGYGLSSKPSEAVGVSPRSWRTMVSFFCCN